MNNLQAKKPKKSIKSGDIITLGEHRLLCGDARNPSLIKNLVKRDKIKLILTDPPYGVGYVEGKKNFKQFKNQHQEIKNDHLQSEYEYRDFSKLWLEAIKPYLQRKNALYVFNSDKMLFSLRDGMCDAGFYFAQLLIWAKTQSIIGRLDYLPQHELIAYGWHGKHEFLKSKDKSILFHPKPQKSKLHPTMKPVGLLRRIILNSSRTKDVVYDPFGGSGSTLIACEHTKRKCFIVEIDPKYCQTIVDRFHQLTGINPKYHD